jgi:hypothetical protein
MPVAARFLPAAAKFARQIVPPVVATLIAAFLIAAYNTTFSGHLAQPRMGGRLHVEANATPNAMPTSVAAAKTAEPVAEVITIHEYVDEPERLADKDAGQEAGKDQSAIKVAAEAAPRPEPRRVASIELTQPMPAHVIAQPVPAPVMAPPPMPAPVVVTAPAAAPIAQEPPPVIAATPPMVTVPDRPNARPSEAQAEPPAPPQGPIGMIVNTLKPSNWFARAREFGEKIEQAGNDILPSIRQ